MKIFNVPLALRNSVAILFTKMQNKFAQSGIVRSPFTYILAYIQHKNCFKLKFI